MSTSAHLLPESFPATPLHLPPNINPFASAKSLAPFSLGESSFLHTRSPKHHITLPLNIETPMFEIGERRERAKRVTLPTHLLEEQGQRLRGLLSPTHMGRLNPKISFTYRNSAIHNARSQITTGPSLLSRQSTTKTQLRWPLIRRKADRCKLSSNQFSFSFVPQKTYKIQDYNPVLTSSIQHIEVETQEQNSPSRMNLSAKPGSQSKVASTIASSGFPLRNSDFSNGSVLLFKQNCSQSSLIGSGRQLLDSIPTKELGKTIILPSHYSFGGLIEQPFEVGRTGSGELQSRKWRNHFGLLGGDMKESIHCGPEQRVQYKFQMLGGYGREIKESTMSFCE